MKNKLKGHFEDDTYFTEIPGKSDVVVVRRNVSKLLHNFYTSTSGADVSSQTESLMKTAEQLILSEIKAAPNAKTYYPSFGDDHSVCEQVQYLPPSLLSEKTDEFLSNTTNKQRFIHLVGTCLEENGIPVQRAQGDADLLIVQVALRSAMEQATVLVREDTDLLILLLFHVKSDMKDVFFSSTRASATRRWEIKKNKKNAELSRSQCVQEYLICACIWWLRHHFSAFRCRKICPCEETATKEQTV